MEHTKKIGETTATKLMIIACMYRVQVCYSIKEGEQLVQQGFELVGRDESGCLWRKRKTFEDIAKEREQNFSFVKSENSGEKIL